MNEAELWEAFFDGSSLIIQEFGVLLTLTFGYLAAAYFVGHELSVLQVTIISLLYASSASFIVATMHSTIVKARLFTAQLRALHPDQTFLIGGVFRNIFSIVLALSIPVCLYFMYQVRR